MADPLTIVFAGVAGTGALTWVAYISKQIVEHAKWMAAATVQLDNIESHSAATVNAAAAEIRQVAREAAVELIRTAQKVKEA